MATFEYEINGETFTSQRELTPQEIEEAASKLGLLEARGKQSLSNLPMAGGTIGSIAGGVAGGPAGAVAGGGVGSAAGEFLRQQITGEPTDTTQIVKEGALGVVGEGFGQGMAKVGPMVVKGVKAGLGLEKEAPRQAISLAEREAAQQTAQELGTSIPASRMGGNFSQLLEGLSRTGLGEGRFVAAEKELGEALTAEAKRIVDSVSSKPMTDIEVGEGLRTTFEKADEAFKGKIAPFYKKIDELGGNIPVFTDNMAAKAQKRINEAMKATRSGRTVGIDDETLRILKDVADVKSTLTFDQANTLRSQLLSQQRAMGNKYGPNSEASKLLQQQINDLSQAMDLGARSLSPRLQKLYSAVNKEYKTVMRDMYDDVVVSLLNKTPERLGEAMARKGNVTEVLKIRKALQQAKRQGQDVKVLEENLLQGYLVGMTQGLDGELSNMVRMADKLKDKQTKRTFDIMMQLNPTAKENVNKLLQAAKVSARGNAPTILQGKGGVGGLLNTVGLLSGAGGYAAAGASGAGTAVAVALALQAAVGKIMTTPALTNAFLAAERIAQKEGIDAAIKFLQKAQPVRRWLGQETSRSDFGPKFGE